MDTETQLKTLVEDRVASRLWAKDASLWVEQSAGAEPAAEIMGWLDLPGSLPETVARCRALADELKRDGFTTAVVTGMGGSSMTPEVLRVVFAGHASGMALHVLDTVNPGTIGPVTESLDLRRTVFIVASKSGTTIEPLSLEKHFRAAVSEAGATDVSRHFVAISDAGTPLAQRAQAGEFREWLETPADVGGRFSALTAFGMFPAVLLGLETDRFVRGASGMAAACREDSVSNPGLQLGAVLGALANGGRDKVTLITSPGLERFGLWVEQLLAESTGKSGKGLAPVAGEPWLDASQYGTDRNFIYVRMDDAENAECDRHAAAVEAAGHPLTRLSLSGRFDLGQEFFRWEFAVSVAGRIIGIFPFDQPDVNAAKDKARDLLGAGAGQGGGDAAGLEPALRHLLRNPSAGDYVVIAAFMPESGEATAAFQRLRRAITASTGMATIFGYGPRYLHSTGQLYKGGPASVRMLGLISHGSGDIQIPGEQYTLGSLTPAQAYGDFAVMRDSGRRIQAAALGENPVAEIEAAAAELET